MNALAGVSTQQKWASPRGVLQIGFNASGKQSRFEHIRTESRNYLCRHEATIAHVDILNFFKKILAMQSGSGKHTYVACRELADNMMAVCINMKSKGHIEKILSIFESIQKDTTTKSRTGASISEIDIFRNIDFGGIRANIDAYTWHPPVVVARKQHHHVHNMPTSQAPHKHIHSNHQVLKATKLGVIPEILDSYPSIDRVLGDVAIVSTPSSEHPAENHDRASVFMLGDTRVTLVCDGVSHCGHASHGHYITGEAAAVRISENLESALRSVENELMGYFHVLNLVDLHMHHHVSEMVSAENSVASVSLNTAIGALESVIIRVLNEISETISPPESATTLELSFEVNVGTKKYLIAFSVGDSQSLVYNKNTHSITQLNAQMYGGPRANEGAHIYSPKDLEARVPVFKKFSDPLGSISGHGPLDPRKLFVTLCELVPGDMVITASDGLTDAFAEIREDKAMLNRAVLALFLQKIEDKPDQHIAENLLKKSYTITKKPDDITVCVHTVAFDTEVTDITDQIAMRTDRLVSASSSANMGQDSDWTSLRRGGTRDEMDDFM